MRIQLIKSHIHFITLDFPNLRFSKNSKGAPTSNSTCNSFSRLNKHIKKMKKKLKEHRLNKANCKDFIFGLCSWTNLFILNTGLLLWDKCQSHILPAEKCFFTPNYFPAKTQARYQPLDASAIFAHIKMKAKQNIQESLDRQGCITAIGVVGAYFKGLSQIGDLRERFFHCWTPIRSMFFLFFFLIFN